MLVMVIGFCNAAFILLWIMKFLDISRDILRNISVNLYVFLFLCGRKDKLEKEAIRRAGVVKRERIIASIEDTILFLKKMKKIYTNNIYYEGHDQFLKLLYQIESEQTQLDLTEKRNNYYIQGPMARHRRFDRERMKELQNEMELEVEDDVVGVMEEQRRLGEKEGRIRDTPYYQSLGKIRVTKTKNVSNNAWKRMKSMSTRTLALDPNYTSESPLQSEGSSLRKV